MGHKTHPYGFRLGIIKDWKTHWYANNAAGYRSLVGEDLKLRNCIHAEYRGFSDAGIARVEIDRGAQDSVINIHSARPGILIGRDGERVKNLRSKLERITTRRVQLNIIEIEHPELDPYLVGRNIADQLQRRVAYRRAMRQAAQRAMQAGAEGIKIITKGADIGSGDRPNREADVGAGAAPYAAGRYRLRAGGSSHGDGPHRHQGVDIQGRKSCRRRQKLRRKLEDH